MPVAGIDDGQIALHGMFALSRPRAGELLPAVGSSRRTRDMNMSILVTSLFACNHGMIHEEHARGSSIDSESQMGEGALIQGGNHYLHRKPCPNLVFASFHHPFQDGQSQASDEVGNLQEEPPFFAEHL